MFFLQKINCFEEILQVFYYLVVVDVLEFTPSDDDDKTPFANECDSLFYFYNSFSLFLLSIFLSEESDACFKVN